jgi:hypothetical protein
MESLFTFQGGFISGATIVGIATYFFKESFIKLLDVKLEEWKSHLRTGEKQSELILRSHIERKERQLAEFYGPIYSRLKRGRPIYDFWCKGRLEEIESSIIEMFNEHNNAIVNILVTKIHLIEGAKIPDSHIKFLSHVVIWHAYLETKHKGVPFDKEEFPEAYVSDDFENEILSTTEMLKANLDALHKKYGLLTMATAKQQTP